MSAPTATKMSAGDWLCGRVHGEIGTRIDQALREIGKQRCLLDVGCWDGKLSLGHAATLGATEVRGVEIFETPAQEAEQQGIEVARIDLEKDRLPWPDDSVDVIVCNQVLEHLKNIWLPMTEMHRILRTGGHAILSVPNLGSLHNRALLALGRQPTSIRVLGPHVRGYTHDEFRRLVGLGGAYSIVSCRGAGFYPVPSPWSAPLSALWSGGSHTLVLTARKVSNEPVWSEFLSSAIEGGMQTVYTEAANARS